MRLSHPSVAIQPVTREALPYMREEIRAFVFDFGGVVAAQDPRHLRNLLSLTGLSRVEFEKLYFLHRDDYDAGRLTGREYWRKTLSGRVEDPSGHLLDRLVEEDVRSWSVCDGRILTWIERLRRAGFPVGILSNLPRDVLDHCSERFSWWREFDFGVFSCEVGFVKPQEEIYHALVEASGCEAGHLLFIDDRAGNVEAARRAGLGAEVYLSFEHLKAGADSEIPDFALELLPEITGP